MDFSKATTRKGLLTRVSSACYDKDVQQGIGAVLVLVGFALLLSGMIFTIVAYTGPRRNIVGSFPYVGPILIVFGPLFMLSGYFLNHKHDFEQIWFYFKRRSPQTYMEQAYLDSEEINGVLSAICFRVLVCLCVKRKSRTQNEDGVYTDVAENKTENRTENRSEQTSFSFSPLRNCKIHPGISESSVWLCFNIYTVYF